MKVRVAIDRGEFYPWFRWYELGTRVDRKQNSVELDEETLQHWREVLAEAKKIQEQIHIMRFSGE